MRDTHPLAGKTVKLSDGLGPCFAGGDISGAEFIVEDWAENVLGCSVWAADRNPAALEYAIRMFSNGKMVPIDNNAVYGKVGIFGHIVHDSEIIRG